MNTGVNLQRMFEMAKVFFLCNDNWKKQYQKVFFQQNKPDFVKTSENITNSIGKKWRNPPFFCGYWLIPAGAKCRLGVGPGYFKNAKPNAQTGVAIVDSQDTQTLLLLKNSSLEVITCGFSSKDTLSFSSLEEKRCVISLQRALRTMQNTIVEPFELPMENPLQLSPFVFLSSCLIYILANKVWALEHLFCK